MMEKQKRRYTLKEIQAMDAATICRRSCMEMTPEEVKKYLYDRPEFEKTYKKINNENVLKNDEGQSFQNALNAYLDGLYESGELPSQAVSHVLFLGERMILGYHWLAAKDEPDRTLQDMMRDNGFHVSDDNKSAYVTAAYVKGKEAHKAAEPKWMSH